MACEDASRLSRDESAKTEHRMSLVLLFVLSSTCAASSISTTIWLTREKRWKEGRQGDVVSQGKRLRSGSEWHWFASGAVCSHLQLRYGNRRHDSKANSHDCSHILWVGSHSTLFRPEGSRCKSGSLGPKTQRKASRGFAFARDGCIGLTKSMTVLCAGRMGSEGGGRANARG